MILIRNPKERTEWIVVLQSENLARMKQGDPVTIPDLGLTICFEELPQETLIAKLGEEDPLRYLTRGWAEHPDDFGDVVPIKTRKTNGPRQS